SVVTSVIARRVSWRRYVGGAIVACFCLNVACTSISAFAPILVLRLAAGVTSGMIYSAGLALLSRSDHATRDFSLLVFLQVLANALVLSIFPGLAQTWGPAGLFAIIAVTLGATLAIVPWLPTHSAESAATGHFRPSGRDFGWRFPSKLRELPA